MKALSILEKVSQFFVFLKKNNILFYNFLG